MTTLPKPTWSNNSFRCDARDEDTWRDAARVTTARDWDADEADLIEQAIAVPDDDSEFDR